MKEILDFLVRHGALVLFAAVLVEQLGLPIPAAPWLLAAGALSASGQFNALSALAVTVLACMIADSIWFYLGRHSGNRVLRLLCRITLEPDSCVRRTQDVFARYGMRGVMVAKFLPGLSTLIPPLAGGSGVSAPRFLFFDGVGSLLYGGCFILLGGLFSHQLEQVMSALSGLGSSALILIGGLAAAYIGYKYFKRHRLLQELRMARITVDELHKKQESGENPLVLDLRAPAELDQNPAIIRGAIHVTIDEMDRRHQEIPRDRDIIIYCSCPNEVGSARMALSLHRRGIVRVRPLLGGFDAWQERKYPTDVRNLALANALNFSSFSQSPALLESAVIQISVTGEQQSVKAQETQTG
jgi:membrane protein DedA with SNARE-associated domain/rhodanese-related sulfurtransferase